MADTLPNGVVVPNADGGETISTTGVAELRTTGASIDTLLSDKASLEQLSALTPNLFSRGAIPPSSDISTFNTSQYSGLWHVNSQSIAKTITGKPADLGSNVQFELLVAMGSTGLQYLYPYGYYENLPFCYVRRLTSAVSPKAWTEWVPWDPSDSGGTGDVVDGTEGAWATNSAQVARFLGVMGGPIDTEGKAAVAIRFDHGLANFQSKVLPLTKARGLKVSQAYNPRNWHYPENAGVTPDDLNSWVAAGDVEIWNHSASHQPADTEEELYDEIVNGLHEIEQQLPAAKGQVWGWVPPGVSSGDYGGYNAGKTPAGWDTYAGRLILAYHAVAAGSLIGTQLHPLDGVPRPGVARVQMDSMTVEAIKARVDDAIAGVKGLQLMLHPSLLDSSGYITTAQFTEVLDYLVTKRDAGQIVTLSPYELTIANASRLQVGVDDVVGLDERLTVLEQDTGWRDVTSGMSPAVVSGVLALRRIGDTVWADFRSLLGAAPSSSWYSFSGALPLGFRSMRNWQYVAVPSWTSTTTPGPLRIATNGSIVIYNAKNSSGAAQTVEGLVSWVTNDAFPDPLPGQMVMEPRRARDVDPDFVTPPD